MTERESTVHECAFTNEHALKSSVYVDAKSTRNLSNGNTDMCLLLAGLTGLLSSVLEVNNLMVEKLYIRFPQITSIMIGQATGRQREVGEEGGGRTGKEMRRKGQK